VNENLKILVEPNAHRLLNVGDVGMLEIAVELAALWQKASIHVITEDPARLQRYCPRLGHTRRVAAEEALRPLLFGAWLRDLQPCEA
jgi:hypothetical protein